jgi:hypothetical protein
VNVDEMLAEMTSVQLSEWIAFSRLEPFGFKAELYGNAVTSSVIANVNRKKNSTPFKPEDFMPQERTTKQSGSFIQNLKQFFGLNNKDK